jgi:hypothetical protein
MTYRGQVQNGVVVFSQPVPIPEGAEVEVAVVSEEPGEPSPPVKRTLRERLNNVIGKAEGMPTDASVNLDHYLYGLPKK